MQDLKDVTNNVHYENYRCLKLAGVVNSPDPKHFQAPSRYGSMTKVESQSACELIGCLIVQRSPCPV